uniref:Rab-GAP TBC domain-containing protein n=1 Tax=Echinostoma caproni TaxID=27848 RepID=A0A183AZ53_9TREM
LNECLLDMLTLCPRLSLVAFGGHCVYLSLLTLLTMCRQRARRLSVQDECADEFTLLIQRDCCQMIGPRPSHVPATVQLWYSTVLEAGKDPARRALAAERCISAALSQPRWHFLSAGEFESQVSDFFV